MSLKQPSHHLRPDEIRLSFTEDYDPSSKVKVVFYVIKIIS